MIKRPIGMMSETGTSAPTKPAASAAAGAYPSPQPFLHAEGIHKHFGGVWALRGAELAIERGEVHSLVGANGSGKSTLLNILSGQIPPDAGTITLDGRPVRLRDPAHALAAGIAVVTQETTLVAGMSVAENILLGPRKVRRWYGIDWRATRRRAEEILEPLEVDFSADRMVSDLRADQQQMVEIARAISMNASLLLLDEPTSALDDSQVDSLFQLIRRLKGRGLTTVFVSHRMNELFEIADRITVLRDGSTVESGPIQDYDGDRIIQAMVGRAAEAPPVLAPSSRSGVAALNVSGVSVEGRVHDASLTVYPGEVVGLAGLTGSGRTELLDAIFGLRPRVSGSIEVGGAPLRSQRVSEAIAKGLAYVPGDRKTLGLVPNMTLAENLHMARTSASHRLRVVPRGRERSQARDAVREFGIVAASIDAPCTTLSGGNQQKVVLAKWMSTSPRVLLMDEPTRGVDIGAKREIYRLLGEARASGVGILVSSSETEELILLCDRILVMFRGVIVASLDRPHATEAALTRYAMGHL